MRVRSELERVSRPGVEISRAVEEVFSSYGISVAASWTREVLSGAWRMTVTPLDGREGVEVCIEIGAGLSEREMGDAIRREVRSLVDRGLDRWVHPTERHSKQYTNDRWVAL